MNAAHIIGNLTHDPQLRTVNTQNGQQSVCDLDVAVNRTVRGKKITDYFRATCWGKQAENACKYLSRGRKVAISGPVTARPYMGNDGKPRASLEITPDELEYLGGRNDAGGAPSEDDGFVPVDDEELPWNG